jgi:hypothetical protein
MLQCLESAVYRHRATVWISSVRDPIAMLRELDVPPADLWRWTQMLRLFKREQLGLAVDASGAQGLRQSLERCDGLAQPLRELIASECGVAPELLPIAETVIAHRQGPAEMGREDALALIAWPAKRFYDALWNACSVDEKVALRQLAEEGLVNPNNTPAVAQLLNEGLIRRDPVFRFANETFRRFVLEAAPADEVSAWEREGVRLPWGTIATTGVTVAFGLAGLLLLTQEQLVDAWISYVPALAPAIPTMWKVLAVVQKGKFEIAA